MYVYCVYPAISTSPKLLPNYLKISETLNSQDLFKETILPEQILI
jgi:hypothetical protein